MACGGDSTPSCLHEAPQELAMASIPVIPQECHLSWQVRATRPMVVYKGVQQAQLLLWALSQQSSCPDPGAIKHGKVTNHSHITAMTATGKWSRLSQFQPRGSGLTKHHSRRLSGYGKHSQLLQTSEDFSIILEVQICNFLGFFPKSWFGKNIPPEKPNS